MSPFSYTLVLREKNLRANVAFLAKTGEQRKTDSRQLVRGGGEGEGGDGGRGGRRQRVNESTDSRYVMSGFPDGGGMAQSASPSVVVLDTLLF